MDLALLGIFAAGVGTFFAPCVLPLIPVYLSALVGSDIRQIQGLGRGQVMARSVLFALGFITVFSLLGLGAAQLGQFFQGNKGLVQFIGAFIIGLFGLKFLGVIRIPLMDRILRADDRRVAGTRFGWLNAVVMGVVFAAGWSPCVGPILGSVLTYTASKGADLWTGFVYLTVYGVGFAVPLVVAAGFAEAGVRFIRRSSRLLPYFERIMGVLMLAAALSLLGGLLPQASALFRQSPDLAAETSAGVSGEGSLADPMKPDRFPVLVEFYSDHCPVCRGMAPVMESLTTQCHGQKVDIRQVNVSEAVNRRYIAQLRILGLPTFILLDKDGFEVARLIGSQTEDALKQALSVLRGEPCPGVGGVPNLGDLHRLQQSEGSSCEGGGAASGQSEGVSGAVE